MVRRACFLLALTLLLAACGGGGGGSKRPAPTATTSATARPTPTGTPPAPTPAVRIPNVAPATELTLPAGFTAYTVAQGLSNPTSIALAPDGTVYVANTPSVFRLVDANGDGVFETSVRYASGFGQINGIMVGPDGTLYVSSTGSVTTVRDTNGDGVGDDKNAVITGLPHGRHQNNGLVIGPDGKLYITNGSTCDDCEEQDPRSATILQANIDGSSLRVYAHGLRNPYALVFDDQGRLWASDNGSDSPCATIDELDLIVDGGDYGWPYASKGCDANAAGTPPSGNLGLHTAATGITFYGGTQFPPEYRRNFFITLWGGTISPAGPPALIRATVQERSSGPAPGRPPPAQVEQFASGFVHPIDVVVDRDGTSLVLDYGSGKLYRIVYTGG